MTIIRPRRLNHLNVVVEDFDVAVKHFADLYGADFLLDLPGPAMHAGLIEIGRVIIELFVPEVWLLGARYGPHYLGVEYEADMAEVRAAVTEGGIRIVRDIGVALHTLPADSFGSAFEFYDGSFHDNDWPLLGGGKMRSAAFWRDDHPLGLTGLEGFTMAVTDLAAARSFLARFLGATVLYEEDRPDLAARAIGLQVADAWIELLAPVAAGPVRAHLDRFGDGIMSTVFGACDPGRVRRHFAGHGIDLVPGSRADRLAVPAARNLGLIFEFQT